MGANTFRNDRRARAALARFSSALAIWGDEGVKVSRTLDHGRAQRGSGAYFEKGKARIQAVVHCRHHPVSGRRLAWTNSQVALGTFLEFGFKSRHQLTEGESTQSRWRAHGCSGADSDMGAPAGGQAIAACLIPLTMAVSISRGSSVSQHLRATKEILQDAIYDTK